jgi:CDP-paratose 2-epimerase
MKILITGVCGFVGSSLAKTIRESAPNFDVIGIDNFLRTGSEQNRPVLKKIGVTVIHADIRSAADIDNLPHADWVVDAAANPSVLAGIDGKSSSRQVVEHNLFGTVNLLEYCKRSHAGLILLSTSRVYSVGPLVNLKIDVHDRAFRPKPDALPNGINVNGVTEAFSTSPPVSLYGSTKVASEHLALEYGETFGIPVWINRCGVLAGAGQFGRIDQGIFSFWIHSYCAKRPLRYIGFGGKGYQVRDCLYPQDLLPLLIAQMQAVKKSVRIMNVSGGIANAMSLAQLTDWCRQRFTPYKIDSQPEDRPFDVPWLVLDSDLARREWNWRPQTNLNDVLEEIADHAERNPDWLDLSAD